MTWFLVRVLSFLCKRLGWQIAIGEDDKGNVSDIILGPRDKIDAILSKIE